MENMIWGTAYMRNCNEFCNNQTYLTAMYYGTGTQLKPSHPTFDVVRVDLIYWETYSGKCLKH